MQNIRNTCKIQRTFGGESAAPLGVRIRLGGALGHPLKVGPVPGQHKVCGGPPGVPQKRKYIVEYGKASGVRILRLFFMFCWALLSAWAQAFKGPWVALLGPPGPL